MSGEIEAAASGPAGWLTGSLLAVLGVWKAYRTIKDTAGDDRAIARKEDYQDDLVARIDHLEKRADMFAAEKNLAVLEEAKAKGKLEALQGELQAVKDSRVEAKELVKKLGEQIDLLREENSRLKARVAELEALVYICPTPPTIPADKPEMHIPLTYGTEKDE